jgi:predicted MFS family arabinose efflux permease
MTLLRRVLDATGYRSALRHRDLRLLLGSQVTSLTGNWAYNVALLVYVYDRTHSLGWVGAASTLRFVPGIALSAYGGVIAERFERRRVMVTVNLLAMLCQVGLCVLAARHGPAAVAIALAVLNASTVTPYEPCVAATLPAAAGEPDLPAANALVHTVENLVILVGPALGALLLLLFSPSLVFAFNALSFALATLLVLRISVRSVPVDVTEGGTAGLRAQLAVGLRAVVSSRRTSVLVAGTALASFLYGTDTVQLVGVATERLGTGARGYGWLLGAMGLGGLLAAMTVNRISRRPRVGGLIIGGIAAMCVPTLLLVVVREPALAAALEVVRGAGTLVVDVLATIGLQRSVAPDQLGRVFGVLWAFVLASIALGAAIMSPLIHAVGLVGSLWVIGLAPLALAIACYPLLRSVDDEAAASVHALAPRIDLLHASPLFAAADRVVLERLATSSAELDVPAGIEVVREGDPADALYLLVAGSAEATTVRPGAEIRVLGALGPGTVFGEIGLLNRVPRTATVTALEACRLLRIDGDAFLEALTSDPLAALVTEIARSRQADASPRPRDAEAVT